MLSSCLNIVVIMPECFQRCLHSVSCFYHLITWASLRKGMRVKMPRFVKSLVRRKTQAGYGSIRCPGQTTKTVRSIPRKHIEKHRYPMVSYGIPQNTTWKVNENHWIFPPKVRYPRYAVLLGFGAWLRGSWALGLLCG